MKQIFLMLAGTFAFILLVGLLVKNPPALNLAPSASPTPDKTITPNATMTIGNTKISVEIADTNEKRSKGLGGIKSLPENEGMLFVFESKNIVPSFWMKGMLIPLDFIWIKNNTVAQIDQNVPNPAPNTPDNKLQIITPNQGVDYCLEVNAGFAAKNKIKVGDTVTLLQ